MLILLPVNDNGIKILTKDIQHIRFAEIVNSLQPNELVLEIPKFQIEFSSEISKYLIPVRRQINVNCYFYIYFFSAKNT